MKSLLLCHYWWYIVYSNTFSAYSITTNKSRWASLSWRAIQVAATLRRRSSYDTLHSLSFTESYDESSARCNNTEIDHGVQAWIIPDCLHRKKSYITHLSIEDQEKLRYMSSARCCTLLFDTSSKIDLKSTFQIYIPVFISLLKPTWWNYSFISTNLLSHL